MVSVDRMALSTVDSKLPINGINLLYVGVELSTDRRSVLVAGIVSAGVYPAPLDKSVPLLGSGVATTFPEVVLLSHVHAGPFDETKLSFNEDFALEYELRFSV
jgi:hypothetical protein